MKKIFILIVAVLFYSGISTVYAESEPIVFTSEEKALLTGNSEISLSAEEKVWLKKHPVIRVGDSSDFEPELIKNADGTLSGFVPDFYHLLGKRLGVRFEVVDDQWPNILKRMGEKDIDMVAQMGKAPAVKRGWVTMSAPYNNLVTVFARKDRMFEVTEDSDIEGLRVAYYREILIFRDYFQKRKAKLRSVETDGVLEAITMVVQGKADIFVGFNFDSYLLFKNMICEIEPIHVLESMPAEFVIAIREDAPLLKSILGKAVNSISYREKYRILSKWSWVPESKTSDLSLTREEVHYLQHKSCLRVANLKDFMPFSFVKDGVPAGFSVEYMKLLGDHLGKEVLFITASWGRLLDMLKRGELDIIPHIAETRERKSYVDYTDFKHITYTTGFAVRKSDHLSSIKELAGKTVAVAKKSFMHDHLKTHHPEITLLVAETTTKAIEAVSKDKAFAVIASLPFLNFQIQREWLSNLKTVVIDDLGIPAKTELPMGVAKGNAVLKSILEKAHDSLPSQEVLKLRDKWIYGSRKVQDSFSLDDREKAFIKQHPTIRFRIRTGRPPFEFEQNGQADGLAVEYLKVISQKVGITPRFVLDDSNFETAFNMVEKGREAFDTLAFLVKNEARSRRFAFGDAYLSYPMMIISYKNGPYIGKTSDLAGKNVAVEQGFLTNEWLKRDFPEINIIPAVSTKDALQMVNDEEVDAYIGNLAVANYMMVHGGMENLKIVAPSEYGNIKYHFIAPREWPELTSILSKGYRSLSPHEHSTLQQRWFSVQMVERVDYELLWKVLGGIALVGLWILWWNRKLRIQKNKTDNALLQLQQTQALLKIKYDELEELSVTDKLTSLYNRLKLDEVLQNEFERARRYHTSFGLIMMDIDFFKQVNDTYGHQIGDMVLVEIAGILKTHFRSIDTVGRWGGEEFLVICPQTGREGLMKLAEHLRDTVEKHEFPEVGHKTASFGAALYTDDDSIETLISRADAALYQSKETGRNKVTFNQ